MAVKEKSVEELQREILSVELETKSLQLDEARQKNTDFKERETRRKRANAQRQADMAQERRMHESNQEACAHMSGGEAGGSPLEGGGKFAFSVLTRARMPDGVTILLQCSRCRLKLKGRERSKVEEKKMEAAANKAGSGSSEMRVWENYLRWKDLMKISRKEGIPNNETRGPTFTFQNSEGINFIPAEV